MKIAIDISQIVYTGSGVARYTTNLVRSICKYDIENKYTFFFSSLRGTLPSEIEALILVKHRLVKLKLPPTLLDFLWNRLHIVPIETFVGPQDIFISSDWTQPPTKAKKVTIVHDLIAYKYPDELHPKTEFTVRSLNLSSNIVAIQKRRLEWVKREVDCIIADSEATKKDIIEILKIDKNKIHVVYPAVDIKQSSLRNALYDSRYILTVGKLEPRKNIARLIEAFVEADLRDIDLLIVGAKGWEENSLYVKRTTLHDNIKFLGFVPDEELYELYSNALFFIYPSLYEGFGYPVVEAMSLDCPVATSNTSSLKEIGEGAALLFNPTSVQEIKNALVMLSNDQKLRERLIYAGKIRAGDFDMKGFVNRFAEIIT